MQIKTKIKFNVLYIRSKHRLFSVNIQNWPECVKRNYQILLVYEKHFDNLH